MPPHHRLTTRFSKLHLNPFWFLYPRKDLPEIGSKAPWVDPQGDAAELEYAARLWHRHDGLKLASTGPTSHALPPPARSGDGAASWLGTTGRGISVPTMPKSRAHGIRVVDLHSMKSGLRE